MVPPANGTPEIRTRNTRHLIVVTALAAAWLAAAVPSSAQKKAEYVPGELLVGMSGDAAFAGLMIPKELGQVTGNVAKLGTIKVKAADGANIEDVAASLRARPGVEYVERNAIYRKTATPNDTYYSYQYAHPKAQTNRAWEIWKPKATVVVAIVDTGVDYTHPDLYNKILRSNGVVVGYNATGSNDRGGPSDPIDDEGHGTHCAGIVAAQANNGMGVAGVAGWNGSAGSSDSRFTKIMPVKVLGSDGSGSTKGVADGVTWAADRGAKVISLSLGSSSYSYTLEKAVNYALSKGCVVVAAAGNDSISDYEYPAAYKNVISVASTDSSDTLSEFSNYGSWVKCAAPGSSIASTMPTYPTAGSDATDYAYMSGTSMATPFVAGEAALIMAQNPNLTNAQVSALILQNVDGYSPYYGYIAAGAGRVNVYRALQAATPKPTPRAGIADFNGDGKPDSVAFNPSTGAIAVLLMDGATITNSYSLAPALPQGWLVGGTGDFHGNGTTSLAVQNLATQQISILGVSGNKVVSSTPLTPSMLPNWKIRAAGDFNGDGQPDLVAQNTNSREISILTIKNLKITASIPVRPALAAGWQVSGAADLDGNGSTDILVQNPAAQQVSVLYMSGTTIASSVSITPSLAAGWIISGVSDIDGNGKPDILVQKTSTRQISALFLNGTKFVDSKPVTPQLLAGWELVGPR